MRTLGTVILGCLIAALFLWGSNRATGVEDQSDMDAHDSYSVRVFGAVGDGQVDDTAAFQAAIDAAAIHGGVVHVPSGKFRIAGSLTMKPGVTLQGTAHSPQAIAPLKGSVILATGGRDNEEGPALFSVGQSSAVMGVTIWWPEQKPTDIHPYPYAFHMTGFDGTIENVTLINAFNGVKVGPEENVRHRIRSLVGCVLNKGIVVDSCTDIGRIENVQFHCHWWSSPETGGEWDPVFKYMVEHLEAFTFGRTDWEYVSNNFVFPAKVGYRFIQTEKGACNGQFTGNGADATQTAVLIEGIQPMGLLFTGGQFVSFTGDDPVQVRVTETCNGSVRFVNCAFWGPAQYNAVLRGPEASVSFTDCYLSNWNEKTKDKPLILAEAGRLQVSNSSFHPPNVAVELGPNVAHAIIQGNNGKGGVRVTDNTNGKAIIVNNEPPPPAAVEAQPPATLEAAPAVTVPPTPTEDVNGQEEPTKEI